MIEYEYPLNERIRTLLRLEDLFAKFTFFCAQQQDSEHHAALLTLFEIIEVASRADLKSDLIQELERQKQSLEALRLNPAVSVAALDDVLRDITCTATGLQEIPGKAGQHLRENDWLMSIKQRTSIPGGVSEFDLPSYHFWLCQEPDVRRADLKLWVTPLLPIYDGLRIVLKILRDSGKSNHFTATQGTFQQMLSGKIAQMLRVGVDSGLPCFPEISANKYAINIRFTTLGGAERPRACERDVEFQLMLCCL